jgi:hypothetical protein
LEGRNASTHLRLADAYAAAGQREEAALELRSAIALGASPEARRRLADVYAALDRQEDSARERRAYTEQRLRELRERAGEAPI